MGLQLGTTGQARRGVRRARVNLQNDTSLLPPGLFESNADTEAMVLRLQLDTLDNLRFLRAGYALDALPSAGRVTAGPHGAVKLR